MLKSLLLMMCFLYSFSQTLAMDKPISSKALKHLEKAREYRSFVDERTPKEYLAAIKANNGYFPQAFRELSLYLADNLLFSEAYLYFEQYMSQAEHSKIAAVDLEILTDLQKAKDFQMYYKTTEKPNLSDLLEFIKLIKKYSDNDKALPYAQKAVQLYDKLSDAHLTLALLLNEAPQKYYHINKALELDPNNPQAHQQLAVYYTFSGNNDEKLKAIEHYKTALLLSEGKITRAWYGLGQTFALLGRKQEAIDAFNHFLTLSSISEDEAQEIKRIVNRLQTNGENPTKPIVDP